MYMDFYYDGQYLSDFGYILCSFDDASGAETVSSGSQITFNTASFEGGKKFAIINTQYDECISATFQICKNPCMFDDITLTPDDYREIVCWLNRHEFLKFYLLDDESDYYDYYFEATFNCNAIKIGDKILGIELSMTTNRPFAIHDPIVVNTSVSDNGAFHFNFDYTSDEVGYVYPKIKLTIGNYSDNAKVHDFTIGFSHYGGRGSSLELSNCSEGEVITIEYPKITSSNTEHDLFNDFNFGFPTIGKSYNKNTNYIVGSGFIGDIEIEYTPVVKVGV